MEAFVGSNIFATKGLEYLVIIVFLVLLIPFWIIVNRGLTVKSVVSQKVSAFLKNGFINPKPGLLYFKNHTWAFLDKTGIAKIGMGQFITRLLGDVSIDPIVQIGARVQKGDVIATLQQNGKSLHVKSPISGKIQAINSSLIKKPTVLTEDSGQNAWLFSLQPEDWKSDTNNVFSAQEAKTWISAELVRLRDFLAEVLKQDSGRPAPVVLQEGGELRPGIMSDFSKEVWQGFQENFLDEKE